MSEMSIEDQIKAATATVKTKLAKDPTFEAIKVLKNKKTQADDSVGNVLTFDHVLHGARFTVSITIGARPIDKDEPLVDEVEETLLGLQKSVNTFLKSLISTIKPIKQTSDE